MTFDNTVTIVSFLIALIGCGIGISGYLARTKTESVHLGEMKGMLDGIREGVETIRVEQKAMQNTLAEVSNKIAAVEASDKAAHRRIDRLE